jgi:exodeoxyribonuclease VII small subunit
MAKEANMSYEQARTALEEIVTQLESGNLALEETLKLWEKGEELASLCQNILDSAQERLEELTAEDENDEEE